MSGNSDEPEYIDTVFRDGMLYLAEDVEEKDSITYEIEPQGIGEIRQYLVKFTTFDVAGMPEEARKALAAESLFTELAGSGVLVDLENGDVFDAKIRLEGTEIFDSVKVSCVITPDFRCI